MATIKYPAFPRQVRLEPVHGCFLNCSFCPLSGEENREITLMTEELFSKILDEITENQVSQVSFGLHGEPTMHPSLVDWIRRTRRNLPKAKINMLTNGFIIEESQNCEPINELFEAGCSGIVLDLYGKKIDELFEAHKAEITAHIADSSEENIWSSKHKQLLSVNHPITANFNEEHNVRTFDTQGGSVKYDRWKKFGVDVSALPVFQTCKELNKYIAIRANGKVKVCCSDGSNAFPLGDINKQTIKEVWQSEKADMVRYALHRGRRDIIPACYSCTRRSFRDGLWPHWGKIYLLEEIRDKILREAELSSDFMRNMRALNADFPIQAEPLKTLVQGTQ